MYTSDAKFQNVKAFVSAMVDEFEINKCNYVDTSYIYQDHWLPIIGKFLNCKRIKMPKRLAIASCIYKGDEIVGTWYFNVVFDINWFIRPFAAMYSIVLRRQPETFPKVESKSQEFFKEDPALWPTILKSLLSKWKCFTVKVLRLSIHPWNLQYFSTSNDTIIKQTSARHLAWPSLQQLANKIT